MVQSILLERVTHLMRIASGVAKVTSLMRIASVVVNVIPVKKLHCLGEVNSRERGPLLWLGASLETNCSESVLANGNCDEDDRCSRSMNANGLEGDRDLDDRRGPWSDDESGRRG